MYSYSSITDLSFITKTNYKTNKTASCSANTKKSTKEILKHLHLLRNFVQETLKIIIIDEKKGLTKSVIFCSGKIYFDLKKEIETKKLKGIQLVRLEQLYPFPESELTSFTNSIKCKNFLWVQEEPENMGAWLMIRHRLEKLLNKTKKGYKLGVVARNPSAAPAGGYQKYHQKRQKEIVRRALEY